MSKEIVALLAALGTLYAASASAGVLFKEDFEAAAVNQQLSTLGFTYPSPATSAKVQDVQSVTGTGKAFDGRIGHGSGQATGILAVRRDIPTASAGASRVEISIDAYIPGPNGNQAFELFGNGPGDPRWADISYTGSGSVGFTSNFFNADGVFVSTYPFFINVTDQVVNLKIVYDITNHLLWTEVNGTRSDPFDLPPGSEAEMNMIEIFNDLRGGLSDPIHGQGSIWDNLTVTEFTAKPGDFNGDNAVDGADFLIWQRNFETASGATTATGDADSDGDVDANDLATWKMNFASATSSASAVPEPASVSLALLFMGLCARLVHPRRFRPVC